MSRVLPVLVAALSLIPAVDAFAKCSPHKTMRIVMRFDAPELPADHFARKPKTLYRLGEKYGRIEEEPNPETGLHLLIVVNEPDLWMVNRADKTGQHAVDPGPTLAFGAPIAGDVKSEYWNNFEFGCEVPFMNSVKDVRKSVDGAGNVLYEHEAEDVKASLLVGTNGIPRRVTIVTGESTFGYIYDVYEQSSDADTRPFERPEGIRFTEAEQQ